MAALFRRKPKARGYTLRHATSRNQCRIFPILSNPIPTSPGHKPRICPICQVHHPCKVLHLRVGPNGEVMVSKGVLDAMQSAGTGMDGFTLESETKEPPTLRMGRGGDRVQVDSDNRSQHIYGSELKKEANNG